MVNTARPASTDYVTKLPELPILGQGANEFHCTSSWSDCALNVIKEGMFQNSVLPNNVGAETGSDSLVQIPELCWSAHSEICCRKCQHRVSPHLNFQHEIPTSKISGINK